MKKIIILCVFAVVAFSGCLYEDASLHEHDEHDHSVEIEGSSMKTLSIQEVADLWEINAEVLLQKTDACKL